MHNRRIFQSVILLTFAFAFCARTLAQGTEQPTTPCTGAPIPGDLQTVQQTVDASPDGSVICLQPGQWNWPAGLNTSKPYELRGAGDFISPWGSAGQTIIHVGQSPNPTIGAYLPSNGPVIIDNIRFLIDGQTVGGRTNYGMMTFGPIPGAGLFADDGFIVHHIDIFATEQCEGPRFFSVGSRGGLIYRSKFTVDVNNPMCNFTNQSMQGVVHYINDFSPDKGWWHSPSTRGSLDPDGISNVYVEDSYWEGFNVVTDCGSSCRMVWRFNENHSAILVNHGNDSNIGGRTQEAYKNHFFCDIQIKMNSYIGHRAAGYYIYDNTFDPRDTSLCAYGGGGFNPIAMYLFRLVQCEEIGGHPGAFPDNYPLARQLGWGWIDGQNISTPFEEEPAALEPIYIGGNRGDYHAGIQSGYRGECRAMGYSASAKAATGTTLSAEGWTSPDQTAFVAYTDLVGGSAPTITDNFGLNWTPVEGGMNGSQRLRGWIARTTTRGTLTVTIHFDSSSAARAATLVLMRNVALTSAVDSNPPVQTVNASPYIAPATNVLTSPNHIVLGYFALNGPTTQGGPGGNQMLDDALGVALPNLRAVSCGGCPGGTGIVGTSGDTDTSNVSLAVTYRVVGPYGYDGDQATSVVSPSLWNYTANRMGLAGTIAFQLTGSPDLLTTEFAQWDREVYNQAESFDGASGVGSGPRSARPATCKEGVGYWATDQGNWNKTPIGGQGVMDKCTATNTWTDGWYTPYTYPHPRANVLGAPIMTFVQQPTTIAIGSPFLPLVAIQMSTTATDSITASVDASSPSGCVIPPVTVNAVAGRATFTGLSPTTSTGSGCKLRIHNNDHATVLDIVSNAFNVVGAGTLTLSYIQTPTATQQGATFTPPVSGHISASAAAVQASIASGPCTLRPPTTATASGTTWTLNGMGVEASSLPADCTLAVQAASGSTAAETAAFNVHAAPIPEGCSGPCVTFTSCAMDDGSGCTTLPVDSTGGNLVVFGAVFDDPSYGDNGCEVTVSDSKNAGFPMENFSTTWIVPNLTRTVIGYWPNATTGSGHTWTLSVGACSGRAQARLMVVVFRGMLADPWDGFVGGNYPANENQSLTAGGPIEPSQTCNVNVSFKSFLQFSVTNPTVNPAMTLLAYEARDYYNWALAAWWTQQATAAAFTPTWMWAENSGGVGLMYSFKSASTAVPCTNEPNVGTMAFAQQPTDTIIGQAITPSPRVTLSTNATDSLTISAEPGGNCTVTANPSSLLTVTANATTGATFNGILPESVFQPEPCELRVHNNTHPAMPDITSNVFTINPGAVTPGLVFVQQPTNTVSGQNFNPPVLVQQPAGASAVRRRR